jgi:TolB-like protein/Tfp pilus assembly protein PilF
MSMFPSSLPRLFAELKRRKVFRVMAVYGATSFVVLQAADLMLPRLGLPDWTVTFLVVLVVLAFPVVLIIAWAFELTPEGMRKTDEAAPEEIDDIVAQPASKRWPSGLVALAGIVALVVGAVWVGRQTAPRVVDAAADAGMPPAGTPLALAESEDDSRPSVAVLPFVNMSADPDQEYFSDGITEELLNTLARISDLKVIARTSAFAFKGRQLDIRDLGDSLGVAYLVEGSVRKAGNRLRITAQLIDTEDGSHLWSDQYDRELDDVFAIQTEIAQAIAAELRVPLRLDQAEKLVTSTADLDAYDLYLEGRARTKERGENLADAVRLFEEAIARDSTWAPAWAGLAEALELIGWYDAAWEEQPADERERQAIIDAFWNRAQQAAHRALELDPDNASAHVALGSVLRNRRQWDASEAAYLEALDSDPDNAEAYQQYSQLLFYVGRATESVRVARRAVALDRSAARLMGLGVALMGAGHDEEALEIIEEGMRLDPEGHVSGGLSTIKMQILLGFRRFEGLRDLFTDAGWPPALVDQIIESLHAGSLDDLPTELRDYLESQPLFLMPLGQQDQAAEALLEAARADPLAALQVMWMPLFDPIREHAAYLETLRVLNLEGAAPDRPVP